MKKLLLAGLVAALLAAVPARAQSDFDGTWRIDLSKSVMPTKAEAFLLQNGISVQELRSHHQHQSAWPRPDCNRESVLRRVQCQGVG